MQKQLKKEELILLQDQAYSNETLCMLLESFELVAFSKKKDLKRKYSYYDLSRETKSIDRLYFDLILLIQNFKVSCFGLTYSKYNKEEKYLFPSNLGYDEIKKDLEEWVSIDKNLFQYANALLSYLKGQFRNVNVETNYRKFIKGDKRKINSREMIGNLVGATYHVGTLEKEIKKNYENGINTISIKKYGNASQNPIGQGMVKYNQQMKEAEATPRKKIEDKKVIRYFSDTYYKYLMNIYNAKKCQHQIEPNDIVKLSCGNCKSYWYFHSNCKNCVDGNCEKIEESQETRECHGCALKFGHFYNAEIFCSKCGEIYFDNNLLE